MNSLNCVIVNGNLTRDCDLKRGNSGTAFGTACIAVNSSTKKGEEWVKETSFFDIKCFGKLFEAQQPFMKKGANITVQGKLKQETWDGKDGTKKSKVTILADMIYLTGGKKQNSETPEVNVRAEEEPQPQAEAPSGEDFPEDFPF